MKTFSLRVIAITTLAVSFASGADDTTSENRLSWGGLDLRYCMIDLRSDKAVQWFFFHGNGTVSAALGYKNSSVSQPLLMWRISGKWLHILDEDGKLLIQMLCLTNNEKQITVDNGKGEKEEYVIQQNGVPSR